MGTFKYPGQSVAQSARSVNVLCTPPHLQLTTSVIGTLCDTTVVPASLSLTRRVAVYIPADNALLLQNTSVIISLPGLIEPPVV